MEKKLLLIGILLFVTMLTNAQKDSVLIDRTRTVCVDSVCKELRCDHGLDLHTFEVWNGDFIGLTQPAQKVNGYYLGTLGVQLTMYTDENQFWKGGKFSLFMVNNYGMNPSANDVGDFQVFDNMEAPGNRKFYVTKDQTIDYRNFFYCFYYEHTFKNFRILAGQYDLNYDFAYSNTGLNFINSSFGVSPAITVNVPSFSTFPFTALSARAEYNMGRFYFRSAVAEGTGGDQFVNLHGNSYNFQNHEGVFVVNEIERRDEVNGVLKSAIKLGVWNHTGKIFFDRRDTTGSTLVKGNSGIYFLADKLIYAEKQDSAQGLKGFLSLDYTPGKQNMFTSCVGGGLSYVGLLGKRPEDVLSVGAFFPMVNKDLVRDQGFAKTEIEAELNYNIKINAYINFQPCFQYIFQPGAQLGTYNPFVFMGRLSIRNGLFN